MSARTLHVCVCVIDPLPPLTLLPLHPGKYIVLMPPKKVYYCDCQRHCRGQIKVVPKTTFFRHAKYRDPHSQFSPQFREYLNANPQIFSSSAHKDMQRSRRCVNEGGGPQAERVHLSPGDHNNERDSVSAFPHAHTRGC